MGIGQRLRHNLSLKLASLVIALLIWGTVHNQANPLLTRERVMRVEAVNVPEKLAAAEIDPPQVNVTLHGRRSALDRLDYSDFRMVVNLSTGAIGTMEVPIKPQDLPAGLEIQRISDTSADVTLDAVISATRPVTAQTRGEPAAGFMVGDISARPHEVTVSGPSSDVRKVTRVLAPVDVAGRNQTIPSPSDLMAVDAAGAVVSGVTISPSQAEITVQMRQVNSRTIPVVPVIANVPAGWQVTSVSVRPVVVTISGQPAAIARVTEIQTQPFSLSGQPGQTQYTVPLQLPSGATPLGSSSVRVTVTLRAQTAPEPSRRQPASPAADDSSTQDDAEPDAPPAPPPGAKPPPDTPPDGAGGAGAGGTTTPARSGGGATSPRPAGGSPPPGGKAASTPAAGGAAR